MIQEDQCKINYFIFDLNSPFTNDKLNTITINLADGNEIFGLNCIFMTPLISSGIYYDILTYSFCSSQSIYTSSFDPKNNFEKIDSLDHSKLITSVQYVNYIGGIANNSKQKPLIYVLGKNKPLYMTFDFQNLFSTKFGVCSEALSNEPFFNKIKYFKQTNQYVTFSKNYA